MWGMISGRNREENQLIMLTTLLTIFCHKVLVY